MVDSRVNSLINNHGMSSNVSFRGNGNNGNSKISELEESNNRMTFDLALEMVDAVLIRFGLEDNMRENNKVYDLFNEGINSQMVR